MRTRFGKLGKNGIPFSGSTFNNPFRGAFMKFILCLFGKNKPCIPALGSWQLEYADVRFLGPLKNDRFPLPQNRSRTFARHNKIINAFRRTADGDRPFIRKTMNCCGKRILQHRQFKRRTEIIAYRDNRLFFSCGNKPRKISNRFVGGFKLYFVVFSEAVQTDRKMIGEYFPIVFLRILRRFLNPEFE